VYSYSIIPYFDVYKCFPDEEDTSNQVPQLTGYQEDSILAAVNYHGVSVAPSDPPADADALVFVDTVSSIVNAALRVGYRIKSPATRTQP